MTTLGMAKHQMLQLTTTSSQDPNCRGLIVIDGTYRFGQTSSGSSALGLSSLDIDLKKTYRPHYTAGDEVDIVDVPVRPYLMIDGCLPFVVFSQGALPPDFLA